MHPTPTAGEESRRSSQAPASAPETASAAPRLSENLLRSVVETAMDAIVVIDENQHIILFNPAAALMFGRSSQEALGRPLDELLPKRFRAGHYALVRRFGDQPQRPRLMAHERVVYGLRSNGEEFPAEASISAAMDGPHRIHTVILRDITEKERNRRALERSNWDLQQFAFVASHDLRAPLRSIQGYLSLLDTRHAGALDDKARSLIQRASDAASHLDTLTDGLLSYASIDSDTAHESDVDCNLVLADCMRLLHSGISESAAQIHSEVLPVVHGDRAQLLQLFQNLLANALKYCKGRAPAVHVKAWAGAGEWVFSFSDNGIGIEAQHRDHIFDAFRRLHTPQEYPGTGIGLAICQRIVHRHGGRIWVESTPGQGSNFLFTLQSPNAHT